ncbi:unnamed protein product, partial [Meganyctiphanes norvegica]
MVLLQRNSLCLLLWYFLESFINHAVAQDLPPHHFAHRRFLDPRQQHYFLLWTPGEDVLTIELQVATLGWVGLGFSPSGGMGGADIVMAWVKEDGTVNLQDYHATGNSAPVLDTSQDYELLGGSQNDTHTTIRFTRPWRTCDQEHDMQLEDDTLRLIWAFHSEDPDDKVEPEYYHMANRGTRSMYLREPEYAKDQLNEDYQYWDVTSPNVTLPADVKTLYWCKLFKIPDLPRKNHVVGYVPMIPKENSLYVHHMILYECSLDQSAEKLERYVGKDGVQCYTPNMPPSWYTCNRPLIMWGPGGEGLAFPDHVGFPIGEEHGGANYFLLEVHYDNPYNEAGIFDNSGLRVFHTDKLRKYDAGIMTTGHRTSPTLFIPPGQEEWTSLGMCSSDCTKKGLPKGGIRILYSLLHTHLLGTALTLRHIRDGKELKPICVDKTYDFEYQEARVLDEEVAVLPGDALHTECVYNSKNKPIPTFGGFGTPEEMCYTFLLYYPKVDLSECLSNPKLEVISQHLGIEEFFPSPYYAIIQGVIGEYPDVPFGDYVDDDKFVANVESKESLKESTDVVVSYMLGALIVKEPISLQNKSLLEILYYPGTWSNQPWVKNLEELMRETPQISGCYLNGRTSIPDVPRIVSIPEFEPYIYPEESCQPNSKTGAPEAKTSTKVSYTDTEAVITTTTVTDYATIITVSRIGADGIPRFGLQTDRS